MHEVPTTPAARLAAIDRSLGVQFRPTERVAPSPSTALAAASAAVELDEVDSLEALKTLAAQAFPFCASLGGAQQLVFGEGAADADLVFAKVTTHARRTLSFSAFRREALPALAEKKRVEPDLLLRHVCKHAGRGPAYGGSSSTSGGAASQP